MISLTRISIFVLIVINTCLSQVTQVVHPDIYAAPVAPSAGSQTIAAGQNYQGIFVERYSPSVRKIGIYSVNGTPYLFSSPVLANVYCGDGAGINRMVGYNLYDEAFEVFEGVISEDKVIKKKLNEIDSVKVFPGSDSERLFINARHMGGANTLLLERLYKGSTISLYKSYKSILENSSNDYTKSNEKEFRIKVMYYYVYSGTSGIQKLNTSKSALRAAFKNNRYAEPVINVEGFHSSEIDLVNLFTALNKI